MFVTFIEGTDQHLASMAMSNCYGKPCNIKTLRTAVEDGHRSLLEHINVTFNMECSQKLLAQITRHRHFSYTVQSTRGMNCTNNGWFNNWTKPENCTETEWLEFMRDYEVMAMMAQDLQYRHENIPKEYLGYMLPLGMNVQFTMTGNLRAWVEYLKQRLCKRASVEHQQFARLVYFELHKVYPELVTLDTIGLCKNCTERSCDFTVHKAEKKTPVILELKEE